MLKKLLACFVLLVMFFLCGGCFWAPSDIDIYRGDYPELLTVALHSLPGVFDSDRNQIEVLQTDEYGRTLFAYSTLSYTVGAPDTPVGTWYDNDTRLFGILICQAVEEESVYFYENCNYLIAEAAAQEDQTLSDYVLQLFSGEDILHLKTEKRLGTASCITKCCRRSRRCALELSGDTAG